MNAPEPNAGSVEQAHQWFDKAENDLAAARILVAAAGPPDTIAFLSQQAAEKYLKGFLVWHGVPFRKVHDLLEVLNACRGVDATLRVLQPDCAALNPMSVRIRYPGFESALTPEDAVDAVARAAKIRKRIRESLSLSTD